MDKALGLGSSFQLFVANFYPRCPNPDVALGMPPHSDHTLLTLLIENEVGGLQIQHKGRWVNVNALPNSILVNSGDQLELVNHGIPEELMNAVSKATKEFFDLPESEKKQYEAKSASDPIKCGNFNVTTTSNQTFTLWRDYLKLYVHPEFHCPLIPQVLREVLLEYSQRTRKLARELVEAVSETLELEKQYVDQVLKLDSSFQMFAANFYPPCPQPDQAIGIPPHSDPGLFTFLIHNGVAGLQIQHDGQWFNAESPPNSILVNVADQLEIFTNGRCKSVMHRAVVNSERERMSIVVANGPSSEAVVGPAAPLVKKDGRAFYRPMKYEEYVVSQLTKSRLNGKPILEQMKIHDD